MRGHAHGPFNAIGQNQPNPVLRVQRQIHLTPGVTVSVQVEASLVEPCFLKIKNYVQTAVVSGTNALTIGNAGNASAYLASGDTTLTGAGFNTEKQFFLTANDTLIAKMTSAAIAASLALTIALITGADTQTVSVGGVTYTLHTSLSGFTTTPNAVLIGADVTAMAANLASAINAGAGAGTTYGTGTVANPLVSATSALGVLTTTAKTPGTGGNAIVTGETLTNGSWAGGGVTLAGGAAADTVGSCWVFIDA